MEATPGTISSLQTVQLSLDGMAVPAEASDKFDDLHRLIGKEVDRYRIHSLLGRGGMGWVFLAQHLQLNRPCALKILAPGLVRKDHDYLERFYSEGQAAASLNHENVVTVHAIGQFQGLHFLEMEFVPGQSLQKLINQQSVLPVRAATIALGIAEGLGNAHRNSIIHRDLKPDNVLLTHRGIPKIGDFGLAKRLHGRGASERQGTLAGTPHFMAPELFLGQEATPAADVYALGVTFYFMLAGKVPFTGKNFNALSDAIQQSPPPDIRSLRPDVPLEFGECLSLLLEKSPQNRPQTGIEASQLLQAILGEARDIESLLHEAFGNFPYVKWQRQGKVFELDVTLSNGRRQTVFVETSAHDLGERLLQIFSLCCPAEGHYYIEALRLNSVIPHGAIALREVDNREHFVTVNNYPLATVDAEEIRRSVLELAHCADAIELKLTGEDRN
jgi:serine/threonine-protein kinase